MKDVMKKQNRKLYIKREKLENADEIFYKNKFWQMLHEDKTFLLIIF